MILTGDYMAFKCFNCFMGLGDPEDRDRCTGDCEKCVTLIKECENCAFRNKVDKEGFIDCFLPDNYPLRKRFIDDHRFKYEFIGPQLLISDEPYPF